MARGPKRGGLSLDLLPRPSGVVIDLDGTLVDTVPARITAWTAALRSFGFDVAAGQVGRLIGMDGGRLAQEVAASFGRMVTDSQAHEIDRAAGKLYEVVNAHPSPLPGSLDLLQLLERRGAPWAIATSSRGGQLHASLATLGLPPTTLVVDGDAVPQAKPAPDLLLRAAELLAIAPEVCWYVGDSIWDMQAAVAARMTGVGVTSGAVADADLILAGAAAVVPSLEIVVDDLKDRL